MNKLPTITASKSIYKNEFLEIKVDTLSLDEHSWEYAYFIKPNKNAAGVLALDGRGVYLVNQYRHPSHDFFWQIPMGMVDVGSNELETAKKELQEETGIKAAKLTCIGSFLAEPGASNQKMFVYVGEELTLGKKHQEVKEIGMKLKHFTFEEIKQCISEGTIKCGFTLSALLLLKNNYLKSVE